MKRTVLRLSLVLICCFSALVSRAQLSLGLRTGVNFANLAVIDEESYPFKPKSGLSFALLFNLPLGASTAIQIEPGFSQRGARISTKTNDFVNNQQVKAEVEGRLLVNYIEVPVLFSLNQNLEKWKVFFPSDLNCD